MFIVEGLNILTFSHGYSLIKKDNSVFLPEPHIWIKYLRVYLKLHDLTKLPNLQIVAHMEAEKELSYQALLINHLGIDAFDHYAQQRWVLEPEVFVFNFALGCMVSRKATY